MAAPAAVDSAISFTPRAKPRAPPMADPMFEIIMFPTLILCSFSFISLFFNALSASLISYAITPNVNAVPIPGSLAKAFSNFMPLPLDLAISASLINWPPTFLPSRTVPAGQRCLAAATALAAFGLPLSSAARAPAPGTNFNNIFPRDESARAAIFAIKFFTPSSLLII